VSLEVAPISWMVKARIVRIKRIVAYTFLKPIISYRDPQIKRKLAPHRKLEPATFVKNSSSLKFILP